MTGEERIEQAVEAGAMALHNGWGDDTAFAIAPPMDEEARNLARRVLGAALAALGPGPVVVEDGKVTPVERVPPGEFRAGSLFAPTQED